MSQRYIHTDKYDALTGWDAPLHHFFITIFNVDMGPNEEDEFAYNNLADSRSLPGGGTTLEGVLLKLNEFKIPIPDGFIARLQKDAAGNVMNERTDINLRSTKR